jgi:hypothetical protein
MEAKERIVKSGWEYDHLFPKAINVDKTVKKSANVEDTVAFIPKVIANTRWQVASFVNQELKSLPLVNACQKLWGFVYDHIAYKRDDQGVEQVRSPRRLWSDKKGDCDCYTVFIGACLSLLNDLKNKGRIILRITKYGKDHFQHIYPVVVTPDGKQIILDCVVDHFNYEEPFTEKKDFIMDLNYLDGVPMKKNADAQISGEQGELGKLFDFLKKKPASTTSTSEPKKESKLKTFLKKTVNAVNKVNPATVLLRAGVLASLKLNIMKVSQRLKYAYLSDAEAQKRGVDMGKFQKLKQVREKIEKIYYGAGGDPKNFKEAILTGKGNEKKEVPVSGLGIVSQNSASGMDSYTPLTKLLGQEMYYSEFMNGTEEISGLGTLGEPATGTAIAAASGVMAAIASLLKNLSNLFPGKTKESADFENTADANAEAEKVAASEGDVNLEELTTDLENESRQTRSMTTDAGTSEDSSDKSADDPAEETWWQKHKKWLKPTLIGLGVAAAAGGTYLALKPKQGAKKKDKALDGVTSKPKTTKKRKKAASKKVKTVKLK